MSIENGCSRQNIHGKRSVHWYSCIDLSELTKVLVTTEGFVSEVRSWYVPSRQLSRRLKVAGTDRDNSLIFIRSKNLPYLVMTDQSASSTTSVPTLPSPLSSRFRREQLKRTFQSQPTHPSTYNFTQVQITQLALLFLVSLPATLGFLWEGRPASKGGQWGSHMWSNCPKAYKASSNVLK